jgi:hypothetical protein
VGGRVKCSLSKWTSRTSVIRHLTRRGLARGSDADTPPSASINCRHKTHPSSNSSAVLTADTSDSPLLFFYKRHELSFSTTVLSSLYHNHFSQHLNTPWTQSRKRSHNARRRAGYGHEVLLDSECVLIVSQSALVTYVTAGYPTAQDTPDIMLGMEAGGAGTYNEQLSLGIAQEQSIDLCRYH